MSEEARAVLEAARKLPPDQQILIAETLYEEQGYERVEMDDEEFAAELERRADETGQGIPWETVRDMQ